LDKKANWDPLFINEQWRLTSQAWARKPNNVTKKEVR